jgi:ABC-type transporter Mla subunit MlaD
VHDADGDTYALIRMKLDKEVEPLPVDSRVMVRPRSALGLKYVELRPGTSRAGFRAGDTVPLGGARPVPVEIDEVFNMFDARTRLGIRRSLEGFGNGLTGRGTNLNEAIRRLPPFLGNLQPVMRNLSDPRTRLRRLFPALARAARLVAPVADTQAQLFVNLDTTFAALARVARPYIQDTISLSPPFMEAGIRDFPVQRPFFRNTAGLMRELRPGVRVLPTTLPVLADALEFGETNLRRAPALNRRLGDVFEALDDFATDPLVRSGLRRLTGTVTSLRPTLNFLAPVQVTCNYATLWFRNISSLLSEGDTNGTWQRFIIVATPSGPNSESGPSSAPANGPNEDNYLHANTYPNTASPGQVKECEAGNEDYIIGQQVLGNLPGNQGTETDDQVKP